MFQDTKVTTWYNFTSYNIYLDGSVSEKHTFTASKSTDCLSPVCCHACIALVMVNLANPHWRNIDCKKTLSPDFLCSLPNKHFNKATEPQNVSVYFCPKFLVRAGKRCLDFRPKHKNMQEFKNCPSSSENIFHLQYLFDAVTDLYFPPIFAPDAQYHTIIIQMKYRYIKHKIVNNCVAGVILCSQNISITAVGGNLHKSLDNSYTSAVFVCDDPHSCLCSQTEEVDNICKFAKSENGKPRCSNLYYTSHDRNCFAFLLDYAPKDDQKSLEEIKCRNGKLIGNDFQNDLVDDCYPGGEDEFLLDSIFYHGSYFPCANSYQIPCRDGHPKCYNFSEICEYQMSQEGKLMTCRTGEHLKNCKSFECNAMFKCPHYYCIPWKHVCDTKWDCPSGSDESSHFCEKVGKCANLFNCKNFTTCVHLSDVCDGTADCPMKDDEFLCSLHNKTCPAPCVCHTFAILCTNTTIRDHFFGGFFSPHSLCVQDSSFELTSNLVLQKLITLKIQHSNLENLCSIIYESKYVLTVDVGFNAMKTIPNGCFSTPNTLQELQINNNRLATLNSKVFSGLLLLRFVNLSNNPLSMIQADVFCTNSALQLVSLIVTMVAVSNESIFQTTALKVLETNDVRFCCILPPGAQCTSQIPWHMSCSDLLPNTAIKVTFYAMSSTIFVANIISLCLQRITFGKGLEKTGAPGTTVALINSVDILCSVPLLMLWITDLIYTEQFIFNEEYWKRSVVCYLIFATTFLFNVLSPVSLSWLSVSRLMVVEHPVDTMFKETSFVQKCVAYIYASCVSLSVVVTVLNWALNSYVLHSVLPLSLCSPYVDPENNATAQKVLTWITIILQLFAAIFIISVYRKMVLAIKESQKFLQECVSRKHSNKMLIAQLLVVTSSNILCWVPCAVIYLISMFAEEYPIKMVYWATVVLSPLNSTINPIVFVVGTIKKLKSSP